MIEKPTDKNPGPTVDQVISQIRQAADDLDAGHAVEPSMEPQSLTDNETVELDVMCSRISSGSVFVLEVMSQKQLRKIEFSEDDTRFFRCAGARLAQHIFYRNEAMHGPRDNTPRIADVIADPNSGQYLEVGIGPPALPSGALSLQRNRYPLSQQLSLPYYEFHSPARLNDCPMEGPELDSKDRPALPDWGQAHLQAASASAPQSAGLGAPGE